MYATYFGERVRLQCCLRILAYSTSRVHSTHQPEYAGPSIVLSNIEVSGEVVKTLANEDCTLSSHLDSPIILA